MTVVTFEPELLQMQQQKTQEPMRNAIPGIMSQIPRIGTTKNSTTQKAPIKAKLTAPKMIQPRPQHPLLELVTEEVIGTPPLEGAPVGTVMLRDCFVSLICRGASIVVV